MPNSEKGSEARVFLDFSDRKMAAKDFEEGLLAGFSSEVQGKRQVLRDLL